VGARKQIAPGEHDRNRLFLNGGRLLIAQTRHGMAKNF
jgi:hypothetical protein